MRISDWSSDVCSSDLQFLAEVIKQVEADLKTARLTARVTGRPKHYYSIYQKMIVGGREFSDIYDLVGIRILVEEDRECYSRSEERSVGKECVSPCRSRGSP